MIFHAKKKLNGPPLGCGTFGNWQPWTRGIQNCFYFCLSFIFLEKSETKVWDHLFKDIFLKYIRSHFLKWYQNNTALYYWSGCSFAISFFGFTIFFRGQFQSQSLCSTYKRKREGRGGTQYAFKFISFELFLRLP